jgi:hypothetical protein
MAKKFVLVDPLLYRPSLSEKSLSGLDSEIRNTLNSQLPDDEKAKLYVSALRRFKAYDTPPPQPKKNLEFIDELAPNQQYKARKLMRLIKENPDIIWSDSGELIYKQTKVPKSHAADLSEDALSTKRTVEGRIGWEAFDKGLEGIPSTLVKRSAPKRKRGRQKWII